MRPLQNTMAAPLRRAARRASFAIVLAAVVGVAPRAHATVLTPMDFTEQCKHAERIFVGSVRSIESRRNPSAPLYFETLVTFAVEQTVAGASVPEVQLRFSGGTVDGMRQVIEGMPEFTVGERYVVLANGAGERPSISPITGFNQGLYRVEAPAGAPRALVRDRLGQPLREAWSAAGIGIPDALRSNTAADEVELSTFLRAIEAARR
jgi:hypothetical protein